MKRPAPERDGALVTLSPSQQPLNFISMTDITHFVPLAPCWPVTSERQLCFASLSQGFVEACYREGTDSGNVCQILLF